MIKTFNQKFKMQKNQTYIFKKFCKRCGKLFRPTGKWNYFCIDCLEKSGSPAHIKVLKKQILIEQRYKENDNK